MREKGLQLTNALQDAHDRGERRFTFEDTYRHKSVKEALIDIQHKKCCFCESVITHVSYGDVEHYRPKRGFFNGETNQLITPGYYWLAYDFSNLFLACQICNQRYKKNYFPLDNERTRARSHEDDLDQEVPLIINPSDDDPLNHLTFEEEFIQALDVKGEKTILRTGLDREELEERRREMLIPLKELAPIARLEHPLGPFTQEKIDAAKTIFKKFSNPSIQYSALVRCNFPDLV